MAHISGLVATGEFNNPFEIVIKTLRGPRSGLIFLKELEEKIKNHNHQIAGVATQLLEVQQPYLQII